MQQKLILKILQVTKILKDTSSFVLKTNLAILKTEVNKLGTDKLKTVPIDLSKLSNAVKMKSLKRLCMRN